MKFHCSRLFMMLPYAGLLGAFFCGFYAFLKFEEYKHNITEIFAQGFEIQWKVSQAMQRLKQVSSHLVLANETGQLSLDMTRQIIILNVNLEQLLSLPYTEQFLFQKNIKQLQKIRNDIEQKIMPAIVAKSDYLSAMNCMRQIEQDMHEISSSSIDHSAMMQKIAQIKATAYKNLFIFAIIFALLAIIYLFFYQRYIFAKRREQYFRSFTSLFAHTTRSRVTALRFFIEKISSHKLPGKEILATALETAKELELINNKLSKIAHLKRDSETEPLAKILDKVSRNVNNSTTLKIDLSSETINLEVPSTQFHLLIDELVQNALVAVKHTGKPKIVIHAYLKRRKFLPYTSLIVQVMDNGVGMTPDKVKKAVIPFFSTGAGKHVGLGLTSCLQMVSTLNGRLTIKSTPNIGTTVKLCIPIE